MNIYREREHFLELHTHFIRCKLQSLNSINSTFLTCPYSVIPSILYMKKVFCFFSKRFPPIYTGIRFICTHGDQNPFHFEKDWCCRSWRNYWKLLSSLSSTVYDKGNLGWTTSPSAQFVHCLNPIFFSQLQKKKLHAENLIS